MKFSTDKHIAASARESPRSSWFRWLGMGLVFLTMVVALWVLPVESWLQSARTWVQAHGFAGAILYVAGFAIGSAVLVPGSLLIMMGGYMFGLWEGVGLVLFGVMFGSVLSALLSRTLLRQSLTQRFASNPTFRALDAAIASRAFLIVLLTRLSLLIPYNVLNLMYGLTRVPYTTLGLASGLGLIPAALLYVYLGTLVDDADQLFAGQNQGGAVGVGLLVVGLICLLAAMLLIHSAATRALRTELAKTAPSVDETEA